MAISVADITPEESIKQNLENYTMERDYSEYKEAARNMAQRFVSYKPGNVIIDLGAGDGAANLILKRVATVIAVDINPVKLQTNSAVCIQADFIGWLELQSNNSLPSIFMHQALEHFVNPQKVLKLISKKLKEEALVLIDVPFGDRLHSVHHAIFETPEDITPPGLDVIDKGQLWIVARKP